MKNLRMTTSIHRKRDKFSGLKSIHKNQKVNWKARYKNAWRKTAKAAEKKRNRLLDLMHNQVIKLEKCHAARSVNTRNPFLF